MKITIFNGNPDPGNEDFDGYLRQLSGALKGGGHEVATLMLRDMDIRQCLGCFDCWVKTPGECVQKDEAVEVCRSMLKSDFVVMASPITMGFTSALFKRAIERILPLLLPYLRIVNGEIRHPLRYDKFPIFGLLLQEAEDTDDEDLSIIMEIYNQLAIEADTPLTFSMLMSSPVGEVADAFDSV